MTSTCLMNCHFIGSIYKASKTYLTTCIRRCSRLSTNGNPSMITIQGQTFQPDEMTTLTPNIIEKVGCNLHNQQNHPLCLIKQCITNFFYKQFTRLGNPLFSVYDNISPIVTVSANFDSVLTPPDHVSRRKGDNFYINKDYMLRAHTSAHQSELIKSGLDAFLVIGDVYRRDHIDASHYPVFHQMEGVQLYSNFQLFGEKSNKTSLFEDGERTVEKQQFHTMIAAKSLEHQLKTTLEGCIQELFGSGLEIKWVDAEFPFTHPSWELEIKFQGEWLEVLGCGIMEQEIISSAINGQKIGYAFGLGLERLAMILFDIPHIKLFWTEDERFLNQFKAKDICSIKFQPYSKYPPLLMDISYWCPPNYEANDFHDLVRNIGGDLVEAVELIDEFVHPKTNVISRCNRITYRSMDRTLTKEEASQIHWKIAAAAEHLLKVDIRKK
ncbi:phenylalanine--tRNA ligase, mitochondrial-like [Anneissia japonica]|uniref:phenylalanine--tRNA ligase, mitochondrial-like n=1 Tax=Anneissia japonica TaxID=1529436 RepID=UPI001425A21E|nr:phenylalanine--tRNA ligase, mitochondrial-like [Anneissia japonica]